jgi:hypothetical protein
MNAMQVQAPGRSDIRQSRPPDIRFRNTAGLSGELSVGDLVAVGEAPLVCERAGWAPLRGGITEARIDEHGTHPLPLPDGLDAPRNANGDPPHLGRNDEIASPTLPGEPAMAREGTQAVNKISRM